MTKREIQVREAAVEDAASIARLLHDFNLEFTEPSPGVEVLGKTVRRLLEAGEITVLLAGDGPEGLSLFRFRPGLWSGGLETYLQELYVVPSRRGGGIGRALLERTIEVARERGADGIDLNTGETDTAARALYESIGFTNAEGGPDGPSMLFYEREV
ncbi:MAG TPA: GNAT family N-acetyltransferase [Solirubrobacterales bacterium]|nr:GNAT family N-acetyltransferase [Solirubrobacterales bacterium]